MFRFQQFTVHDDRCAMKVGTDGVLLGAWTDASAAQKAVDIGTGCGLVALMLAQRYPTLQITAVEIDAEAAAQAAENVEESPFNGQITVVADDAIRFAAHELSESYDLVVSNPPFFQESLLPPDATRATARHTAAGLGFGQLADIAVTLLRPGGRLAVIIPKNAESTFHDICNRHGLSLLHATDIRTVARKPVRRILMCFHKGAPPETVVRDDIILMYEGQRSESYARLCRDFYL